MAAFTGSFSNHLAPGLRGILGTNLANREMFYSRYYMVETSERNYEDYLAAAGLPMAAEKPQGENIVTYDPLEGNTKRFTHKTYGVGFEVSSEAQEDDLYAGKGSAIRDAMSGLADSLAERVEIEAHRPLNAEGFDGSTYLVLPDSSGLFATSHSPVAGGEAAAQANRPTTDVDLSITAYREALIEFETYTNDRGLRIPGYTKPKTLIVPPAQRYSAAEVVRNTMRPDTANDIENFSKDETTISVTPYITDTDQWIVQGSKHFMVFMWRRRPRFKAFDDDRKTISVFTATMRFTVAPVHWLGMYGSTGA